jgi:hypothetical protein
MYIKRKKKRDWVNQRTKRSAVKKKEEKGIFIPTSLLHLDHRSIIKLLFTSPLL